MFQYARNWVRPDPTAPLKHDFQSCKIVSSRKGVSANNPKYLLPVTLHTFIYNMIIGIITCHFYFLVHNNL